jgi:8-oxo-dGTP diphosphatase
MRRFDTLQDVDWERWEPTEHATLLFVVRDGRILLIRKKRGLGAGKINGPGGRLDDGEIPLEAAIREVHEELRVTPVDVRQHGELLFQFVDGFSIHGYVFRADGFEGEPTETDEAIPIWTPVDRIPYGEMWADDRIWLPWLLDRRRFRGWMLFEDDDLLEHRFELYS